MFSNCIHQNSKTRSYKEENRPVPALPISFFISMKNKVFYIWSRFLSPTEDIMKVWVKVDEVLGYPLLWYKRHMAEIIFLWDVYLNISHSLLRTILKAVFAQNIIFNEIYRAELNKLFKFYISEYHKSKYNLFILFFFFFVD